MPRAGRSAAPSCARRTTPRRGFVIYDDTARSAARVRLELTLQRLREMGIEARGEVMDPDPYIATQDAVRQWGADEVIVSTYPYPRSGVLRRDLVERIEKWSGLPVEHVIVDLREEPVRHVLVRREPDVGGPEPDRDARAPRRRPRRTASP